ncbi:MAG: anthranilate phosphoribosyltransferase [Pyrinomonadaceae bacterium]
MNDRILHHYLEEFRADCDLPPDEAETLFDALIAGDNEFIIAELLSAWNDKGTTEEEIFALASLMRSRMKRISSNLKTFVDAVGTGGSRAKTFNVSTAAAFVIAGAGVPVAKHGNRAATSKSGSSDVLAMLGINVELEPDAAERCLNEIGICFMFAPLFHSLSPTLAKARRSLGRPTIFNNLGPLCNPASAPHQLIGVWDKEMLEKTANVLAKLGTERSWIVHGEIGLDEIALAGRTHVIEINGDQTKSFEIEAPEFGVSSGSGQLPSKSSAPDSAKLISEILNNQRSGDDAENLVLINAAAAILITGNASDLPDAFSKAETSVRSGAALEILRRLASETAK